jgi:hypothetical protein
MNVSARIVLYLELKQAGSGRLAILSIQVSGRWNYRSALGLLQIGLNRLDILDCSMSV